MTKLADYLDGKERIGADVSRIRELVFGPEPEPMYAGENRVKQVNALDRLAEDIFQALHPDVPLDEITLNGLDQGGYFPEEWPEWSSWHDETYVVLQVRKKVQQAAWSVADAKIGSGRP